MDNSYRIKANVGVDQVLNINIKQDIDIYEILSLKLKQENLYKLYSANYGVIVGRVLANNAFGVPNAKVSVFIPLSDVDKLRQDIRAIYPYNFVTDVDSRNVRYNTLPNYKKNKCYQEVGSFPNKRLVLDNDSVLEIYDKYYKFSTVTNKAGDYMIFGVPTGEQIIHVDVDLSDIGIISQEPRDFIYKGYPANLFESPTQFKKSTNLDELPQIQSQNASVTVYPLWGDKNTGEIAISRKDINLQYQFETTCVFIGSVITDTGSNSISNDCVPDSKIGEASQLSPNKGKIEMIRKTIDNTVEEYNVKEKELIDGDGTWCYQIPMNLDYIGMDEYGNIVPTNDPSKGIPTRARVRFRFTLDESEEDTFTRHRARYLVPNNPDLYEGNVQPTISADSFDNELNYEFGTLTPEDCFRDLYWNKVYSVKNYIPRLQKSAYEKTELYFAIKGVNKNATRKNNPLPYNKINLNFSVPAYYTMYTFGKGYDGVSGFWNFLKSYMVPFSVDSVREQLLEAFDAIGLDFYNDWLNGCLYFPSWFWHIRQKKNGNNGKTEYEASFCDCNDSSNDGLYIYNNCSLVYKDNDLVVYDTLYKNLYKKFDEDYIILPFGSRKFNGGIIKKKTNKDNLDAFYYSFGNKESSTKVSGNTNFNKNFPDVIRPSSGYEYYNYVRLFSTDIILLGSLKEHDIDGVPMVSLNMPSTTSNIPPMGRYKPQVAEVDNNASAETSNYPSSSKEPNITQHNGMNWGAAWNTSTTIPSELRNNGPYKYKFGSGLFFGIGQREVSAGTEVSYGSIFPWRRTIKRTRTDIIPTSDLKTCINLERICELGVTFDDNYTLKDDNGGADYVLEMDGLITKREIENVNIRALFATLNSNKLIGTVENYNTGYKKYNLEYFYPTNFDGRMESFASDYTSGITTDDRNKDYLDFRFGNKDEKYIDTYRSLSIGFDGKQKYINPNSASFNEGTINVQDGNYIRYYMANGVNKITKFEKPKQRHFYGYKSAQPSQPYPLSYGNLGNFEFTFPLYDNSFYFFFGLNVGSTAIDKFYKQFYSKCDDEKINDDTTS